MPVAARDLLAVPTLARLLKAQHERPSWRKRADEQIQ
jgi:hypothetical protein